MQTSIPWLKYARLPLAIDQVLTVDVGGDLVAGGDHAQVPDNQASLHQ